MDTGERDFSGANMIEADLREADLRGANLIGADLRGANLIGADLSSADLRGANLIGADLRGADLRWANLSRADLSGANLIEADLIEADLSAADLSGANMIEADLREADLRGANLIEADLRGANLIGAKWDYLTTGIHAAPSGTIIVWGKKSGRIVKMRIDENTPRSWATTRKMRAERVLVLEISTGELEFTHQPNYGPSTRYAVGEVTECDGWDGDRWNECSNGIHCFLTREEAEAW